MNNDLEQFSEERLKKLIDFSDSPALVSLARIVLAAKQAKPVGWMDTCELFDLQHGYMSKILPKKEMNNDIPLYATPQPAHTEQVGAPCVKCNGSGLMDSGGTQPWGEPISVECDCTTTQSAHTEPDGWASSRTANDALVMLDRIETTDPADDDRIEGIKRIILQLAAAPKPESE